MKSIASVLKRHKSVLTRMAMIAGIVAFVGIPQMASAQGLIGGARDGSREGNRIGGPVGGVVGGAVGAGVGGVVGGVKGVLGIPDRSYRGNHRRGERCRGYTTKSGKFRCYN
jgi:hypothetical protein